MDLTAAAAYAAIMGPEWYQPVGLGILFVACLLMGLFGADSRPGFDGRPSSYKERWFIHSRRD